MKIRIHDSCIRWRLSRTEAATLQSTGEVAEYVSVGGRNLCFRLGIRTGGAQLSIEFDGSELNYRISPAQARIVTATDGEGFEDTIVQSDGSSLRMLVQKDYACLHKPTEGPETFANPAGD